MLAAALDADISYFALILLLFNVQVTQPGVALIHNAGVVKKTPSLNTHVNVSVGPPRGDSMREEVALLGAPGCGQTAVTEQRRRRRRRRQPDSGEERSGAMPRRFPLREQDGETREAAP